MILLIVNLKIINYSTNKTVNFLKFSYIRKKVISYLNIIANYRLKKLKCYNENIPVILPIRPSR